MVNRWTISDVSPLLLLFIPCVPWPPPLPLPRPAPRPSFSAIYIHKLTEAFVLLPIRTLFDKGNIEFGQNSAVALSFCGIADPHGHTLGSLRTDIHTQPRDGRFAGQLGVTWSLHTERYIEVHLRVLNYVNSHLRTLAIIVVLISLLKGEDIKHC
jgi:hypothetical protein